MMMNLRGLILDDPEYTVHLHTLRFARYHDSDEEPAWDLVWINLKGLSSLQLSIFNFQGKSQYCSLAIGDPID
jgi:hypothetical protein